MAVDYALKSADGAEVKQVLHKTIHRLPGVPLTKPVHAHGAMRPADGMAHGSPFAGGRARLRVQRGASSSGNVVSVGDGRVVELRSTGVQLSYDVTEIHAKVGERLTLRYVNQSEMAHNLVVLRSADDIPVVGLAAIGPQAKDFIPQDKMDRILAHTQARGPQGKPSRLEFTVPETPGVYPYVCTVAGHFSLMQGRIVVTK